MFGLIDHIASFRFVKFALIAFFGWAFLAVPTIVVFGMADLHSVGAIVAFTLFLPIWAWYFWSVYRDKKDFEAERRSESRGQRELSVTDEE